MANYLVTDTELTSVANAIRSKGATSASLSFPTEFVSAIGNIQTSGADSTYTLTNIIPPQTIACTTQANNYCYAGIVSNYTGIPANDKQYLVTFDNVEYLCEGFLGDTSDNNYNYVIGEYRILSSNLAAQYQSVPFCVAYYPADTNPYVVAVKTSGTHTIRVDIINLLEDGISLQAKTGITPTESSQTIEPDNDYDALSSVQINAISSTYVGSGITSRSSTDLSADGATVTVPAGYYASQATKSVSSLTLPTSVSSSATSGYTSKATVSRSTSDQYINIGTGYNSAGGYYKISAVSNGSATAPASITGTSATISTGTGTLTLTKTISVTPSVTEGYVSSGTAGNSSVSLTASVDINPTPTASGATVTIPAGYYSSQTTKSVDTMTLPTSATSSATSGYSSKATISRSTSDQYINIPPGYNSAGGYYKVSAVTNGSATGPTSLSGSSATLSTGTNTITLTKTGVTTTPTVSAGYVSSATASTATVTLTASVTTKAAATITPGTSDQTIVSGTYLTGTQTISGDADLIAANIKTGVNIFGVAGSYTSDATAEASEILSGETAYVNGSKLTGSLVITTVYVGSAAPSASTGINGDIYIQS